MNELRLKAVKHLAMRVGSSPEELLRICREITETPERHYFEWIKTCRGGKRRPMVKVREQLREILERLKVLLQRIELPEYVHGGVRGHSTYTNARPHMGKRVVLCTDLENHFPRVSPRKVYAMFRREQECAPEVARILTRLTTLNGGLPQGSPTSTAVSNLVTLNLSKRLHGFARARGAACTQYVDDYAFSGGRRVARCKEQVVRIAAQEGFKINVAKTKSTSADREQIVTGIKVNGRQGDVPRKKVKEVRRELSELGEKLRLGERPSARVMRSIAGKIRYVKQLNRGCGAFLERQLLRVTMRER